LSKSPWVDGSESALKIAERSLARGEKVAVLHIQDACIATTIDDYCEKLAERGITGYALKADCEARGLLDKVGREIKIVDYKDWIRLVMKERGAVVSWTS